MFPGQAKDSGKARVKAKPLFTRTPPITAGVVRGKEASVKSTGPMDGAKPNVFSKRTSNFPPLFFLLHNNKVKSDQIPPNTCAHQNHFSLFFYYTLDG